MITCYIWWKTTSIRNDSSKPTSHHHAQVKMKSLWNNSVIINHVLQTGSGMGSPCWRICESQAYQFLLIGLALVLSLWLCHLKPHCCLADGISPLTKGLNLPNRPDWKILEPRGGGGSGGISLSPHPLSFLVTLHHELGCWASGKSLPPTAEAACSRPQLSVHCLIGGGSVATMCICYLFVPISRCEALQPTPQPGCATC